MPHHPGATPREPSDGPDLLVREEPLSIAVGDDELLTMRTPGDDFHLALGFLLSEGVIDDPAQVQGHRLLAGDPAELRADRIELQVPATGTRRQGRLTRTHEIRSSCGICGLTDADELLEELRPLLPGVPRIPASRIPELLREFDQLQTLFQATGASHAAALFGSDGSLWGHGEDVGRHNALDKALGQATAAGHDLQQAIVLLSGRAGFDLVMKCLRLGLPIILSVSAASALSFDLCQAAGATLLGFCRDGRYKTYCDPGRIQAQP